MIAVTALTVIEILKVIGNTIVQKERSGSSDPTTCKRESALIDHLSGRTHDPDLAYVDYRQHRRRQDEGPATEIIEPDESIVCSHCTYVQAINDDAVS